MYPSQLGNKMEKYEFRFRYPRWTWFMVAAAICGGILFAVLKEKYDLIIIWIPCFLILLINVTRIYTVTPEAFTVSAKMLKPRTFLLRNITEIEKEYTSNDRLKSIVIRYREKNMYHNYLVIKKDEADIEGIMNAILEYCPSVPVR